MGYRVLADVAQEVVLLLVAFIVGYEPGPSVAAAAVGSSQDQ